MDELRLAIRRLRKRPAATLASILTLAGAIGAAVVMWTVLHALLINPLPVHDPSLLVTIVTMSRGEFMDDAVVYNTYRDLRDHNPFSAIAGWGDAQALLRDRAGERPAPIQFVSTSYFQTLGVRPAIGREFAPHEDQAGAPLVALLSDRYWQTFGRDTSVIGSTIHVAGKPVTIIGVAPRGFRGLELTSAPDLFMPMHVIEDVAPVINYLQQARAKQMSPTAWIAVVARMPADVPAQDVTARLAALPAWSSPAAPKPVLEPLDASALPRRDRAAVVRFTRMLAITVGLLLLTGCATVALLLLVRTEDRRIEFATCLALGASKARLIRGVAIEGALMAIAGAALAVPAGMWLFGLLDTFSLPGGVPLRNLVLDIRGQGIAIAALGALGATLLTVIAVASSGLSTRRMAPALRAAHSTERARPRARSMLIVSQLAIAVVLIAGTGLFIRSLTAGVRVNPDRDASAIVTARFPLRLHGYSPDRARTFHNEIAGRLAGQPSIAAAALIADGLSMRGGLVVDGEKRAFRESAAFTTLHGPYFEALGLRIVEGRPFGPEESPHSPLVGVVSESLARFLVNDRSPIGRRIRLPFSSPGKPPAELTIVGVVEDLITSVRQLQPFVVYLPAVQQPMFAPSTLVARASGDGRAAIREIMSAARAIDPAVAPRVTTLKDSLYNEMRPQQLGATVLGALGAIAAILTILGLYVIAESTAAQRTREFGIRAALGATRRELRALLLRDNLRLATIGALLGLAVVYAGAGTVRAFLFGVEAFDPVTLTAVPSAIVVIAVIVGLGPAVRASRADIAQVLRRE